MSALIGLTLVAMATTLLVQSLATALRVRQQARERFIATQWLAGALDELRATGRVNGSRPSALREATLTVRRAPLGDALDQVTVVARWRQGHAATREAQLTSVIAHR